MLTQILVRKYHFASGHYHPVSVMMERYGSRIMVVMITVGMKMKMETIIRCFCCFPSTEHLPPAK